MKKHSRLAVLLLMLLVAAGIYFAFHGPPAQRETGPLPHACYVWQRAWGQDLKSSIQQAQNDLKGFIVLAAEIDVRPDRQKQVIVPVDYSFLSTLSVPVGVAIRINPYSGPFDEDAPAAYTICQVIDTVLEKAAAAGFEPAEIQIDYDCAESKLSGYRQWIRAVKQDFPQYPVTITALPSWMNNRGFSKLVRSCDGYVLQVHSLEKPDSIDQQVQLCDLKRSVEWVRRADRFQRPFYVALPTYGYFVMYDQQGQFVGLSAEGPKPGSMENTQIKTVLSDPKKIAAMIQEIKSVSPKNLSGVIWFRLPVAGDQLNWQWHTLQRLVQNQPLTEQISVHLDWPQPGLLEVYLVNPGDVDLSGYCVVRLTFQGNCLAADGILGYAVAQGPEKELLFAPEYENAMERLRAQKKIKIGWCRFDQETEVTADVQIRD